MLTREVRNRPHGTGSHTGLVVAIMARIPMVSRALFAGIKS